MALQKRLEAMLFGALIIVGLPASIALSWTLAG